MSLPETAYFDANLPGASQTVRIASLYDAKIFVCRWVIRDRDPELKALLRNAEKAKSFATTESAIQQLTQALSLRGIIGHHWSVGINSARRTLHAAQDKNLGFLLTSRITVTASPDFQ
jgi:hypothetical protein